MHERRPGQEHHGVPKVDTAITDANRVIEEYVNTQMLAEVSAERKTELNTQLVDIADFFTAENIAMSVGGGIGIDLLDGKWDRDHQDVDVVVSGNDRVTLFTAATRKGYMVTTFDLVPLTADSIADPATENAFLFRTDEQGTHHFEAIFQNETANGAIHLTETVAVEREALSALPTVDVEGRRITLQPPEVTLFYKLRDGRRKDLMDVMTYLQSATPEQEERLRHCIAATDMRFTIDGKELTDVRELVRVSLEKHAADHQEFFEKLDVLRADIEARFTTFCKDLMEARQQVADKEALFVAIAERYKGFMPEQRPIIAKMVDALFADPAQTEEQFLAWAKPLVNREERLKVLALHEYVSEKLWRAETRT